MISFSVLKITLLEMYIPIFQTSIIVTRTVFYLTINNWSVCSSIKTIHLPHSFRFQQLLVGRRCNSIFFPFPRKEKENPETLSRSSSEGGAKRKWNGRISLQFCFLVRPKMVTLKLDFFLSLWAFYSAEMINHPSYLEDR
mgnify:CR=1 FL=1